MQIGGRLLGAVSDNDREQDEVGILRFAQKSLIVLKLLPLANSVGDEDQERLDLGNGIEQARLPKMPRTKMSLVDEHVSAGQRIFNRAFEAERERAIRGMKAQENSQTRCLPLEAKQINIEE
jgi:hypothetical protein